MRNALLTAGAMIAAFALGPWARADMIFFGFGGSGVSDSGFLTFGSDPVPGDLADPSPSGGGGHGAHTVTHHALEDIVG